MFKGGHLHGVRGLWDTRRDTRCVMLEDTNLDCALSDGRAHITIQCQLYRVRVEWPDFVPDPEDPAMPLLVVSLAQCISVCNRELH